MKQDLQYALRLMRRRPGSTAAAVLVIALGIGADTAMFSVVNKVLLEPLPYPQPDRLVYLRSDSPMGRAMMSSVPKYLIWRQGKVAFEHAAAFTSVEPVALDDDGGRQLIPRISVSADYFPVFGLRLALGRAFTAAEDVPRGPRVAVISHGLWQRRFGRDPSVVGRSIRLANESVEVVGVTARDAPVDSRIDAWTPLRADDNSADHSSWLQVVARLRPGVTLREAHRQIYGLAGEYHRRYPNSLGPLETFGLTPLRDVVVGEARAAAMFLFGAVTFVLLIACANVANLMLAQTTERQRELSTRAALGARPSRIIGQLLTESVLLSLTGGAIGVALAAAGLQLVTTVGGSYVPLIGSTHVTLDWRVLQFSIALTLLTPLVFGLYPALRASRLDLARQLGSSAGEAGGPAAHARLRGALVVMQMAGALVLLAGAGLLIRSFVSTRTVEPGFVSHNVLTLEMPVSSPRFARTANLAAFVRTAEQRVQVLPDVSVMAAASSLPLEAGASFPFVIDRRPLLRSPFHGTAHWRRVSSGYFDVFGIRPLSGRLFTRHDTAEGLPVAIISDSMARRFWPGNAALGERIRIGRESGVGAVEPARTVVGVVSDVRDTGLNRDPEPMVYVPLAQLTDRLNAFENQSHPLKWVIRTTAAPLRLSDAIERELRASGDNVVVGAVRTMDEVVARSTAQSDFNTLVLTLFAGVSVSLAALGLYGLMSYTIAQRTREIAVRMALGASAWRARRMIFEEAFRLTAGGVVIGAVASLTLARYMDSSIFGIAAWDPTVLGGVTAFLIGVAVITTLLSARRVTTVRAIDALKHI